MPPYAYKPPSAYARKAAAAAGKRLQGWSTASGPRKPRQHPEADLQGATVKYLTYALPPGVLWTATLSGAHLGQAQRVKAKQAGLRRGLSDFVLAVPGKGPFFIEMKPPRGQKVGKHRAYRSLTDEQEAWAAAVGARWATCHSLEEVEAALKRWGVQPRCSISDANRYAIAALPEEPQGEFDLLPETGKS